MIAKTRAMLRSSGCVPAPYSKKAFMITASSNSATFTNFIA